MDPQRTILWWVQCKWLKNIWMVFLGDFPESGGLSVCKGALSLKQEKWEKGYPWGRQHILSFPWPRPIVMLHWGVQIPYHGHHKSELGPCIALNLGSKEQLSSQVTGFRMERNQRFPMKVLASLGLRNRSSERASGFQHHTARMWLNYGIDPEVSNCKSYYFLFHTLSSC